MAISKLKRPLSNNLGVALLITILVVSIMVVITVEFARTMRQNYISTVTSSDGLQLRLIASSGVEIAQKILSGNEEGSEVDTLQDSWALLEPEDFTGLFPRGSLELDITDLSGRFPINFVIIRKESQDKDNEPNVVELKAILNNLLLSGYFAVDDEEHARTIIDSLVDWIDDDDKESEYGAENSYYESLDPPYSSANAPIGSIGELLQVRGVTEDLLYGTKDKDALADYISVLSNDGRINLNTLPVRLLQAIEPELSDDVVELFDEYRRSEDYKDALSNAGWYKDVSGWPGDLTLPATIMTTRSHMFSVAAKASFNDQQRNMTAIVVRNGEELETIRKRLD